MHQSLNQWLLVLFCFVCYVLFCFHRTKTKIMNLDGTVAVYDPAIASSAHLSVPSHLPTVKILSERWIFWHEKSCAAQNSVRFGRRFACLCTVMIFRSFLGQSSYLLGEVFCSSFSTPGVFCVCTDSGLVCYGRRAVHSENLKCLIKHGLLCERVSKWEKCVCMCVCVCERERELEEWGHPLAECTEGDVHIAT